MEPREPIALPLRSLSPVDAFSAHSAFAFGLYGAFAQANSGRNFLFSPVSIFATLSMILPGAQRETLQQLLSAMHLSGSGQAPLSPAALSELESALGRMLAAAAPAGDYGERQPSLLSANRAFIQAGLEVRPDFLAALRDHFKSEILSADFVNNPEAERIRINKWVATLTKDKITDLLQPKSITDLTRLVLVNALYFKAKWALPFNPEYTRLARFELSASATPISVPTMHSKGKQRIVYIPDVLTGVRFDFNDTDAQRMSLLAVLPERRHGLDALFAGMSEQDWQRLVNEPGELMEVEVALPKVKLFGVAELSKDEYLPKLGIIRMFHRKDADLSGMALRPGELFVTSYAHQAALEWDEFGVEGAAASAAIVGRESGSFVLPIFNQPFAVIVTSEVADSDGVSRHVPVFIGRVSDPRG